MQQGQVWSRSRAERFRTAQFRAAQFRAARFSAASGGGGGAETCGAELSSATDEKDMLILFINSLVHKIRLRNDLYCVGWGVKLYSIQSCP